MQLANSSIALLRGDVFRRLQAQFCAGSQLLLKRVDLTRQRHSCSSLRAMGSGEAGRIDIQANALLPPLLELTEGVTKQRQGAVDEPLHWRPPEPAGRRR